MNEEVREIISTEVAIIRKSLLQKVDELKLETLLDKWNPYLLAATCDSLDIILQSGLDAHIGSSRECVFGKCLENIARAVLATHDKNAKSGIAGIDLDFKSGELRILMSVKSGENWGNSNSVNGLSKSLEKAKRTIRQNDTSAVNTVLFCCYGRRKTSDKNKVADYAISGQNAWYFLSGDIDFYKKIIHEMNQKAAEFEKELEDKWDGAYIRLLEELKILCPYGTNIWDILVERCCKNYTETDKHLQHLMGI